MAHAGGVHGKHSEATKPGGSLLQQCSKSIWHWIMWNMTINNHLLIHKHRLASLLKILHNYKTCGLHSGFEWFWQLGATTKKRFQVHLVILFWHDFYSRMSGSHAPQLTTQQIATGWHADGNRPAQPPHGFQLLVAWNYLTYDLSEKETTKWEKHQLIRNDWGSFRFFCVVFVKTKVTLMFLLKRCLPLKCQAVPGLVRTRNDKNPIPY